MRFISSHKCKGSSPSKPAFFYHIPRCAGTTFEISVSSAVLGMEIVLEKEQEKKVTLPKVMRVAGMAQLESLALHNQPFIMYSGVLPYGSHKLMDRIPCELYTIIREPFELLVSRYISECKKSSQEVSEVGFVEYFSRSENTNTMCKQLHPKAYLYESQDHEYHDAQVVIDNLKQNFTVYSTVDDVIPMMESFLSRYSLPNVVVNTLKKSDMTEFNTAVTELDTLKGKVKALNADDYLLYEHVAAAPKIPELDKVGEGVVSDVSCLIWDNSTDGMPDMRAHPMQTQKVLAHLYDVATHGFNPKHLYQLSIDGKF